MIPPVGTRAVVLVDGEHYPPVVRAALAELATAGTQVVAALALGGTEKVAGYGADLELGVPVVWPPRGGELDRTAAVLAELCATHQPDLVYDLSDEPVLDPRSRMRLAAQALHAGVAYAGADFLFDPPPRPRLARRPSIAVIGTGKRTGKTAVAGEVARRLIESGRTPVVVAMGRGGPPEPVVLPAGTALGPAELVAVADAGGHAASDFYEDALTTGAATVGARRCGGGLAGAIGHGNVDAAVRAADDLPGDVTILEGSGSALPPAHADAAILVVPGDCDPEFVRGYLGAYRVLQADLVVVTMCEPPRATREQVDAVVAAVGDIAPSVPTLRTVLRPVPLGPVAGARVFLATTAPSAAARRLVDALERRSGCRVVGVSAHLADRLRLEEDLDRAPACDALLVECKAAAVDVAARWAAIAGARVVFCDNRPEPVAEGSGGSLTDALLTVAGQASRRFVPVS